MAELTRDTIDRIAEAAQAASAIEFVIEAELWNNEAGVLSLITPNGWGRETLDLEKYAPRPRRAKGRFAFTQDASFIAYVNRQKLAAPAPLILATAEGRFTCYLDPHNGPDAPGWHEHVATFALKPTTAWVAWQKADHAPMSQYEFAEFLEDRIGEIASPSASDLFELTRTLRVKQELDFDAGTRPHDGLVRITYRETATASAGAKGEIEIPEQLTLVVQAYEGTQPIEVAARFRYRLSGGKASFTYILGEEVTRVRESAVADAAEAIATGTGLPVLYGVKE